MTLPQPERADDGARTTLDPAGPGGDGAPGRTPPSPRKVYWLAFAVLMVLTSAWSLASPLAAGPDENAHMVKSAAVVRGDLHGDILAASPGSGVVTVPTIYGMMMGYPTCFVFRGDVPADCQPDLPAGQAAEAPTQAETWVIRNNPLYYAITGLPTLLPAGEYTLYLMRLVSAALCSAVLAWAFRSLAEITRRPLVIAGLVTAVTPMVVFLNSTVNPSALEISAALALWVAMLALVRAPDPARLVPRAAGIAVLAVLLGNARGTSPLYVAVIAVAVAVLVGPWRNFATAMLDRRTWPWLGVVVVGNLASLWWSMNAGTLEAGGADHPELGFLSTANRTFFDTGDFLIASIGRFGWTDTHLPMLAYLVYAALAGFPILLALCVGDRRTRVAMLGVLGVAVLLPVLVHAWQARNVGYIWTARYSMPLFVGVSVTAGFLCRDLLRPLPRWVGDRIAGSVAVLASIGMVIAFLTNLRRYVVGDGGSWRQIFSGEWQPPVPGLVLTLLVLAALGAGVWLLDRLVRSPEPAEPTVPEDALPPATPSVLFGDRSTPPTPAR
ncbi:DUF2142 domain-containing protein [Cellulomonas hominis]|uniref:DUF2142 domain-containing protein n=1 Tax=Cellulomonas hominis TaxID=156981 RepID=A0A7Z8K1C3_9CELL|nr:DUF2142 domain-containing protein [Cellulomonas hominis]TKR23670.1 DUF2142 domain-containing protein [Cellulomonas hominis]